MVRSPTSQREIEGRREGFWGDIMDPVVTCVGGIRMNYPEGLKTGAEKRFLGGDIDGEQIIHPCELWDQQKRGNERHMSIGRHVGLPNRGKKQLKAVKGGKVSLANRRLLPEDYRRIYC